MIPSQFDERFLSWFRDQTEATWHNYKTTTLADYIASEIGGEDWQTDTHWLRGLSEQEIAEIEQRWKLRFPPDYRLFLSILHSPDRPFSGARYDESGKLVPIFRPSFYNWQTESAIIEQTYESVIDDMLLDVKNGIWYPGWGEKSSEEKAQEARIRELVATAPRLIPIIGHRFLLVEPCQEGNPVLSVHKTDIIVYAPNLYYYFLDEFSYLLKLSDKELRMVEEHKNQIISERYHTYQTIPFWGEFF